MNIWMYNDEHTFTPSEEELRSENVHLAGHKRYGLYFSNLLEMERYKFRGTHYKKEYLESLQEFESDNIQDVYKELNAFLVDIESSLPILLYDNCESYSFFGSLRDKRRGYVEIKDNVNNTRVKLNWDDILKMYHLLKLYGVQIVDLYANDESEDEGKNDEN